jgi:bifunctional DNA-binding transcriptional regulator/antitoxin component of YhaV-PrlF toxin-antitoxin module
MYDISLNSPSDYENFVDQIIEDDLRRQCTVLIDGKNWIVSDRSKIDISAYELILPKKFAQEFNLDEFDDLNTIVNDQEFFVKRLFAQTNTLIDSNNYDVALKNASQQHIYLLDEKHLVNSNGLHPTTDELQTI